MFLFIYDIYKYEEKMSLKSTFYAFDAAADYKKNQKSLKFFLRWTFSLNADAWRPLKTKCTNYHNYRLTINRKFFSTGYGRGLYEEPRPPNALVPNVASD